MVPFESRELYKYNILYRHILFQFLIYLIVPVPVRYLPYSTNCVYMYSKSTQIYVRLEVPMRYQISVFLARGRGNYTPVLKCLKCSILWFVGWIFLYNELTFQYCEYSTNFDIHELYIRK